MKSWSKIIALALVIVVLAAAFVLLKGGKPSTSGTTDAQASSTPTPTPTSNPDTVKPFDFKKVDIARILLKRDAGDIVLTQAEKEVTTQTQNSDGTTSTTTTPTKVWVTDKFNVETTVVDDVTYAVENATTKRLIEADPKDLSIYGLDQPIVATLYNADAKGETLKIGDKTPTGDSYYILRDGDKAVYTLETYYAEKFTVGQLDLMSKDLYGRTDLTTGDMSDLTFYKGTEEIFASNAASSTVWKMNYPLEIEADSENITKFLQGLSGLKATEIIELNPVDLKLYGLDKPQYTFNYTLAGKPYVLKIGSLKSSRYYAMLDGMNYVFTIDSTSMNYAELPFINMVERLIYLPSIYETSKLTIEIDGRTDNLEMDISQTQTGTESGTDKKPDVYVFNGQKIEGDTKQSLFRSYYQGAIGMMGDRIDLTAKPQGTPFAKLTYTNKADGKTTVVTLIPTPDEYGYYLMKNDTFTGLVMLKSYLDDKDLGIRTFYNNFINGLSVQN